MSKIVQYPERLDSKVDFLNVAVRRAKLQQKPFLRRKKHWEQEEKPSGGSIPIVSSLPASASNGDLVYYDGLYIYHNGWQRIAQTSVMTVAGVAGGAGGAYDGASSLGVVLLPEPEAVYATKTGGGDVYVAVTNGGRMRSLVFDAQTLPASDASASFAMNAGRGNGVRYNLSFVVNSNQSNRTFSFRVYTNNTYDFVVGVDSSGFGFLVLEIGGSEVITVTRRYTQESGVVYPCWTSCGFVVTRG